MAAGNNRPPLQEHGNLEIYRANFEKTYCLKPLLTHDGISVRFRKKDFAHCSQESSKRDGNKDTVSQERLKRIGWIKLALQDPSLQFKAGWLKKEKRYDHHRRVVIMIDNFVVVIRLKSATTADFVTCYVADHHRTQELLKKSPVWVNPYK